METQACTPVLSTSISYLKDRPEVASALIQFSLLNPGWISDFYNDMLISFRTVASEYGDNRDSICTELKRKFQVALRKYFPEDIIITDFTASDYDPDNPDDPRYRVNFNIYFTLPDGSVQPAVLSGYFIAGDESRISLSFI